MSEMNAVIQFRGTVYENGYGMIAQSVMRDKTIHRNSKVIYAYISSFASINTVNGERTAFPSVSLQCSELGMGEDTYYKWRKPLVEKGYISIEKQKTKGKFDRNIYYIETVPKPPEKEEKEKEPETKEPEILSNQGNPPYPKKEGMEEKPYPKNPSTDNQSKENKGTNIISSNSISFNNKNKKNNIYKSDSQKLLAMELLKKGFSDENIESVLKEVNSRNLLDFHMKDVTNQLHDMNNLFNNGASFNGGGFASYFAIGLFGRTENRRMSNLIQFEEEMKQQNAETRDTSIYYNWLDE